MGNNIDGQLGIGDKSIHEKNSPILVESMMMFKPKQVSCGASHTCVVMENGELYSWGLGHQG